VPPSPAVDLNFTFPTPTVTLPTAPTLLALDTVVFNPVTVPAFSATAPTLTAVAPSIMPYVEGALYTSALLTDAQTNLQAALTNNAGTGLAPATEQALWDRGSEREYRAQADALADLDRMEMLGYALPPGVWLDARIKVQTETANARNALSREVMIKQAELTLDNIVKARGDAIQLESQMIGYANNVAQRTFEAAKYVTEAGVQIYNAAVEAYKASLDGYRVQAVIYEAQIRGIEASVEVLKAQIEFEKTKADINTALVSQYESEINAALAALKVTELQVEIIKTQAEVEKIKVEVFGAEVQAYAQTVNAYTAQVEGYKASIEAQASIAQVYKVQVDAYGTQVQAGSTAINAKVAAYRGQIDAYTAQIEVFKAEVQSMAGQAQAASFYNTAAADVYRAQISGLASYNDVLTKQWSAAIDEGIKEADVAVAAAKANGELYISARQLSLDASKVGAQVAAQLGSAALNAIHWSNSSNTSVSAVNSWSESASVSVATNNNYNTTVSE
jgi:hypothetical protein